MQTSLFLARLIGPALLIVGIGVLLNQDYYRSMTQQFVASRPAYYLAAVVGIVAGLAIILVHNVWTLNWRVLITLLGWLHFVRGALSVLFPEKCLAYTTRIVGNKQMPMTAGIVAAAVGAILSFYGYVS